MTRKRGRRMRFRIFFESLTGGLKEKILNSEFLKAIIANKGKPNFVGGAIRDFYLNKKSKDIDVIISGISSENLINLLRNFGKVDEVGQSFGVIKFKPYEFEVDEPIDIALPRTERPMNQDEKEEYKKRVGKYPSAYQAFTTSPDHNMPVHSDLGRRDFTINAIAQDHLGNIIDPYNGIEDIKNKVIRMVDKKAFSQDPLRMLRGVQFASRFDFKIEPETFKEIKDNVSLIKGIPGERILIEIEKIVEKGNQLAGADLLCETGLWQEISGLSCSVHNKEMFDKSKYMSEFLFLMMFGSADENKALQICKKLKCDLNTEKQLKGLYLVWQKKDENPNVIVFELNKIHPSCLNLNLLPENIKKSISSNAPKSITDLEISGNDLMSMGYKGPEIGSVLKDVITQILHGKLHNSKEEIIKYIKH
jgi:tRNA nucleotidyltransferase (CCA-adding enzyme)